ncbi:MAG TPA: hypothetical protein VK184_20685 [Nostocaceae cyanobacterium]|nr:hypothetical protein [Nostocaceae cyanobacterium]
MASHNDPNHDLQRQVEARLRELEEKQRFSEPPVYQTVKHYPEQTQKPWMKKAILGAKLFGLAVAAFVAVRVAAIAAQFIIVAILGWVAYKLFFDRPKK